jgi:hypothetical protein
MNQLKLWPPPNDWSECVVSWDSILESKEFHPRYLYEWCDSHPSLGRYHVHGWQSTEGFAFRFEDPRDAVMFKLRWSCE